MKQIDPTVSQIAALLGQRGGKKMTPKKLRVLRINARKARAARWVKKHSNGAK
jgi:hypothetical protein